MTLPHTAAEAPIPPARPRKDARVNLRVTAQQDDLIRRAAAALETSVSEFILQLATAEAERVLADRRRFTLTSQQWSELQIALDAPMPPPDERLRQLLRQPPDLEFLDR